MKHFKHIGMFFLVMLFTVLSAVSTQAAADPMLEVGEVRSLGQQAKVPVIIRNTSYLTSGHVKVSVPATSKGATLASYEPGALFDEDLFRTESHINNNSLTIDFYSQIGKEQRLMGNAVVGYITYNLSSEFTPGKSIPLEVANLTATGQRGLDLNIQPLHGKIEHKMPIGDVVGKNKVTAAGAIRILQHLNGNYITSREQFLSADVDADGVLTQVDVNYILDYTTGKRMTFLAMVAKDLQTGVVKSEYAEQVEAVHGRAPYTYKRRSGSMPSGLQLNETTGEIKGTPSRAGDYQFTIQVTDIVGDVSERSYSMKVIDSNIKSVEPLEPINVKRGETPDLPKEVMVTYKDNTKGKEKVTWGPVDTSKLGETSAKGEIGNTGFIVTVKIHVVDENYVQNITVEHFELLSLHTITVQATNQVYTAKVDNNMMHYEGDNRFSLVSADYPKGATVTLRLYDKYGNLLETKVHRLIAN
ncbi:putative Ig domain-containing protein [Bacillus sp. FJAT-42315]|uniref:putative Ig domain-containing protein n=1 Tax=Bacillus sp. FJAT-42315 TaxID=2014077 RepID=UPI000C24A6D0|nr:putative Ig domain-containing protein [Bacillus sp. FJAT-42315]